MCEIRDLWLGCAEGLAQKTRPLVAAIEVGNVGSDSLQGRIATETGRVLGEYTTFCRRAQTRTSYGESSMSNVEGAFNHIIGLSRERGADSGWYRSEFVDDNTCRTVLKANVTVKDFLLPFVENELLPELANIRKAWEGGRHIQADWEGLLDRLSLTAEEKREFRTSDEYEMASVPRFNLVEWILPILALRHLVTTGVIEPRTDNFDEQLYADFLEAWRQQGGEVGTHSAEDPAYGVSLERAAQRFRDLA